MNEKYDDGDLKDAVKRAAWKDMAVLRQRRYDSFPKVISREIPATLLEEGNNE
jgi:hypothetical protein